MWLTFVTLSFVVGIASAGLCERLTSVHCSYCPNARIDRQCNGFCSNKCGPRPRIYIPNNGVFVPRKSESEVTAHIQPRVKSGNNRRPPVDKTPMEDGPIGDWNIGSVPRGHEPPPDRFKRPPGWVWNQPIRGGMPEIAWKVPERGKGVKVKVNAKKKCNEVGSPEGFGRPWRVPGDDPEQDSDCNDDDDDEEEDQSDPYDESRFTSGESDLNLKLSEKSTEKPRPKPIKNPRPKPKGKPKRKPNGKRRPKPDRRVKSQEKEKSTEFTDGTKADEKFYGCCKSNKMVSSSCYNLCKFSTLTKATLIDAYMRQSCPPSSLGSVLDCASSRKDHRVCCSTNGLNTFNNGVCVSFCDPSGGLPAITTGFLPCLDKLHIITKCFASNMGR